MRTWGRELCENELMISRSLERIPPESGNKESNSSFAEGGKGKIDNRCREQITTGNGNRLDKKRKEHALFLLRVTKNLV